MAREWEQAVLWAEAWKHAWTRNGPQQLAWMHATVKYHEKLTRNLWREPRHHTRKRLR